MWGPMNWAIRDLVLICRQWEFITGFKPKSVVVFFKIPSDQSSSSVLGVVRWGKTRGTKSSEEAVVNQARRDGG